MEADTKIEVGAQSPMDNAQVGATSPKFEGHADMHKLEPKVQWKARDPMTIGEKLCGALFYAQFFVQLALGFTMIGMKNVVLLPKGDCGAGYTRLQGGPCASDALVDEWTTCQVGRQLAAADSFRSDKNLWESLDEFPEVPVVLVISMVVLAVIWLKVLQKCARPVVWSTFVATEVVCIYLAVRPLTLDAPFGWGFIVIGVLVAAWAIYKRKAIDNAAIVISYACQGLSEMPTIFLWSSVVLTLQSGYICLWACFMVQSAAVWEVKEDCTMSSAKIAQDMRAVLGVLFWPTTYFFQNACLIVCATGIGSWYFHQGDKEAPSQPAMEGFKMAFTTSSGAAFFCAIVNTCCIKAVTRFMLISHTFHGGGIVEVANNSLAVLQRRLGDAVTTDTVATMVLRWSTGIFSTAFGFAAWAWLDACVGVGALASIGEAAVADSAFADILIFFLVLVMFYLVSQPMIAIILLAIFGHLIKIPFILGFLGGVFIGSICCLFFRFFSSVVLNSTDTIFYAFALEADAGMRQERFTKIYECINNVVVVGTPLNPNAVHPENANAMAGSPVTFAPTTEITVQCPPDGKAGMSLQVQAPDGQMCQVAVPPGIGPGENFTCSVPGGSPVHVQAAVIGKDATGGKFAVK